VWAIFPTACCGSAVAWALAVETLCDHSLQNAPNDRGPRDAAEEFHVPTNLQEIFEWAEYIYITYGTYRQVSRKVVRYFLTELMLEGGDEDDREGSFGGANSESEDDGEQLFDKIKRSKGKKSSTSSKSTSSRKEKVKKPRKKAKKR
jgi:hypothetical protein